MTDVTMTEITKPCPECGHPLVVRENRPTGEEFLGRSHYPECRHTEPISEYLRMKRAGAPTLF